MAKIERVYIIPLRRKFQTAPMYRRAKRAVNALREFLMKHMKVDDPSKVKIGRNLNLKIWEKGIKNPPAKVKVNVVKDDEGIVRAELVGFVFEEPVKQMEKKKKPEEPKEGSLKEEKDVKSVKAATKEDAVNESAKEAQKEEEKKILEKPVHEKEHRKEETHPADRPHEKRVEKKIFKRRSE